MFIARFSERFMNIQVLYLVQIQGLMPLGTSMDYESSASRAKGCWDPSPALTPFYEKWTSSTSTPDFVVDDVWCGMVGGIGFGSGVTEEMVGFWKTTLKQVYKGDEGRRKARMAVVCLLERDGLLLRIGDIKCPVYWLQVSINLFVCSIYILTVKQGSEDVPFGTIFPSEQIKLFTSSKEAKLTFIPGGAHYLNATNPVEVNDALLELVTKYK